MMKEESRIALSLTAPLKYSCQWFCTNTNMLTELPTSNMISYFSIMNTVKVYTILRLRVAIVNLDRSLLHLRDKTLVMRKEAED